MLAKKMVWFCSHSHTWQDQLKTKKFWGMLINTESSNSGPIFVCWQALHPHPNEAAHGPTQVLAGNTETMHSTWLFYSPSSDYTKSNAHAISYPGRLPHNNVHMLYKSEFIPLVHFNILNTFIGFSLICIDCNVLNTEFLFLIKHTAVFSLNLNAHNSAYLLRIVNLSLWLPE